MKNPVGPAWALLLAGLCLLHPGARAEEVAEHQARFAAAMDDLRALPAARLRDRVERLRLDLNAFIQEHPQSPEAARSARWMARGMFIASRREKGFQTGALKESLDWLLAQYKHPDPQSDVLAEYIGFEGASWEPGSTLRRLLRDYPDSPGTVDALDLAFSQDEAASQVEGMVALSRMLQSTRIAARTYGAAALLMSRVLVDRYGEISSAVSLYSSYVQVLPEGPAEAGLAVNVARGCLAHGWITEAESWARRVLAGRGPRQGEALLIWCQARMAPDRPVDKVAADLKALLAELGGGHRLDRALRTAGLMAGGSVDRRLGVLLLDQYRARSGDQGLEERRWKWQWHSLAEPGPAPAAPPPGFGRAALHFWTAARTGSTAAVQALRRAALDTKKTDRAARLYWTLWEAAAGRPPGCPNLDGAYDEGEGLIQGAFEALWSCLGDKTLTGPYARAAALYQPDGHGPLRWLLHRWYEKASADPKTRARAWYMRAVICFHDLDVQRGVAFFRKVAQLAPQDPLADDAAFWAGHGLERLGRRSDALREWEMALEKWPEGDMVSDNVLPARILDAYLALGDPGSVQELSEAWTLDLPAWEDSGQAEQYATRASARLDEFADLKKRLAAQP